MAISAETAGDTVLVSMNSAPGAALAITPSAPRATARRASSCGSDENTTGAPRATSATDAAAFAPLATIAATCAAATS